MGRTVYVYAWMCRPTHAHLCVCIISVPKACTSSFFADKSCPENRDGTHQLLGQKEPKLSVWHGAEKETGGGGLKINAKAKNAALSNGHGWNPYSHWISGHSAMSKSPWLFSGSGVAAFQSLLSAHVCDSVLLRGSIFHWRNTSKNLQQN